MPFYTVDLCAGIGGIRKGFEMTGFYKNIMASEVDKYACITYKHLYNEDPCHDLTTEEFKVLLDSTPYDILLAGFPCQTFSRAGLEKGFEDTTNGSQSSYCGGGEEMKSQKNEFPNPVLAAGRDDYIAACQFGTVFDPEKIVVTSDDIIIPISYSLVCNGLQQLIDDNKALAVIGIKSSSSSYSRLFIFPKEETAMELHIPKFKVVL